MAMEINNDEVTLEQELERAKTRYEELFEEANILIATTDSEGYIKKVNKRASGLTGYSKNELVGENILKLAHPDDEDKFVEAWNRVLEGELENIVVRIKTKGEDTRWLKVGGSAIFRDGEVVEIQYTGQDITKLKEAEEEANRERKRFEKLFKGSNDLVATTDLEGKVKRVNENGLDFYGYTEEEAIGTNIIALAHPDDKESWIGFYKELMGGKGEASRVLKGIKKDGETIWLKTGGRVIKEDGEVVEMQYNSQDITQLKKARERQDLLHSLLRHDVRNKAQVVQGYLDLARKHDLSDEVEDHLSKALQGTNEALEIIDKVRTLKEAEEEEIKEIDLEPVINEAVKKAKSVDPEMEFLNKMQCPVDGCKVEGGPLLNEVFSNILENAAQHSGGEKVRVTNQSSDGEMVCIVEDDGRGVPEENREKIFEKGFTTAEKRGTGLGMFLVKKLVEIYDGSIEIKDSDLGGARFDVHLERA